MKTSLWRGMVAGALAMSVLAACDDNPVDEGVDEVARISFEKTYASIAAGDEITMSATALNRYGAPVAADLEFSTCDGLVTVTSSTADSAAVTQSSFATIAAGSTLGYTCVVASAGGASDTLQMVVTLPYLVSSANSGIAGDTIVLTRSVGQPAFDADVSVTATFADGPPLEHKAYWLRMSSTADELHVVLPVNLPEGNYDIAVMNVGAGQNTLPADYEVTGPPSYTDPIDAGDSSTWPQVGPEFEVVGQVDLTDAEDYYLYTVPESGAARCLIEYDLSGANMVFWFYDPAGALFDYDYNWGGGSLNYLFGNGVLHPGSPVPPGTYYINPHNYSGGPATSYHIWCRPA